MSTASAVNRKAKVLPFKTPPLREFPKELIPSHIISEAMKIFDEGTREGRHEEVAHMPEVFGFLGITWRTPKECKKPDNLIRL